MQRQQYRAPWSVGLTVTSVLSLVVAVVGAVVAKDTRLGYFLAATVLGAACFTIRGYELLGDQTLRVKRLFWTTTLSLDGLLSATPDPEALTGAIKTSGNGGLFSYSGWFWSARLGAMRLWVTDPKRSVVLRFPGHTWVVSPDDPQAFAERVTNPA